MGRPFSWSHVTSHTWNYTNKNRCKQTLCDLRVIYREQQSSTYHCDTPALRSSSLKSIWSWKEWRLQLVFCRGSIMSVVLLSDPSCDEYLAKKLFFATHEGNAVLDRHFKMFLLSFFKWHVKIESVGESERWLTFDTQCHRIMIWWMFSLTSHWTQV